MLDGFKNVTLIGSGGFGKVYLAEEELSGKKVAIKQIKQNCFKATNEVIDLINQTING